MSNEKDRILDDEAVPKDSKKKRRRLSMVVESEEEGSSNDEHDMSRLLKGATGNDSEEEKSKPSIASRLKVSIQKGLGESVRVLERVFHLRKPAKNSPHEKDALQKVEEDAGSTSSEDVSESPPEEAEKLAETSSEDSFQEEYLKRIWKTRQKQVCDSLRAMNSQSFKEEEEEEKEESQQTM